MTFGQAASAEQIAALDAAFDELQAVLELAIGAGTMTETESASLWQAMETAGLQVKKAGFPAGDVAALLGLVRARIDFARSRLPAAEHERGRLWPWIAGGVAALGVIGGGIWYATRRRPRRALAAPRWA